jgi:PDZ domain
MRSEAYIDNQANGDQNSQAISTCPNCSALMPREMRFCRACGCRLGEGVEEYTETVRFQSAPDTSRSKKSRTAWAVPPLTATVDAKEFKAMAGRIHEKTVKSMTAGLGKWRVTRACRRVPRWMVWVIVPIMIASMTGGFMSNSRSKRRAQSAQTSYMGADVKTVDSGAFLTDVSPPGSPSDVAGLVGGDVITTFDDKPVKSESDLSNFLRSTPIGKTVSVIYIRDGETRTAQFTTISKDEYDRLGEVFDDRPEGKGFLGVDDDFKRVQVPGMNIYGVQLADVYENRPAYTAGLLEGDIVIEFGGTPIRTVEEFNWRIDRAVPRSTVNVVVMRGGQRLEIPVKMGVE